MGKQHATPLSSIDRRRFLVYTWKGVGANLALALIPGERLFAGHRFGRNPFDLHFVTSVQDTGSTERTVVVEDGVPRAQS